MQVSDSLYGSFEITEPVLIELLQTPTLTRLKGVDMGGFETPWVQRESISRYTHSVGVFLLLRRYRASIKEQIAGLLHDISHTAFSHSIDYALNKKSQEQQDYQDNRYERIFKESEIPTILKKYGFNPDDFLKLEQYELLETELPNLCADRLDYSLRQMIQYSHMFSRFTHENVQIYLEDLQTDGKVWYFTDKDVAYQYTLDFAYLSDNCFAGLPSAKMFATTGDCIAYAVENNILTEESLHATDADILNRLADAAKYDSTLNKFWQRMNGKALFIQEPPFTHVIKCKSRKVDPFIKIDNSFARVSDLFTDWKERLAEEQKPKIWSFSICDTV